MSNNSSPSLMNFLRQYRKPTTSNSSTTSNNPSNSAATSNSRFFTSSNNASSSSISVPRTIGQTLVYKRIRVPESDSDDAASPSKRPTPAPVELTTVVKERRFRNMTEMFPDILPNMIKAVLIKHGWNEERTRDELLNYDPESEVSKPTSSTARPAAFTNGNYATLKVFKQNTPTINTQRFPSSGMEPRYLVVKKPLESKGGRRRKGSSDSEDSDYGVRKGRDDRVYDSDDSDNEPSNDMSGEKRKVYDFLNTAKLNELVLLSGCSQKKAEAIIAQRPFKGWLDMIEKFNNNKNLSTDLLNSTQELLSTRNNIQRLMRKCVGLAQQLEAAVAAGAGLLQQPAIMDSSLTLAPYQLVGLNWLAVLNKQGVSGILADEMGLGKTVQVIAFLSHLKETGQANGTHLVVVPASTLDNWSNEFARWCPSMRVSMYYGAPDDRRTLRVNYVRGGLTDIDVILTTYTMVSSCPEERKMFRVTPLHYVIYDEAHMLKNMSTQRYDNLVRIKSKHRLLLTGTPLQNNLLELMSLLCFVMPQMFHGKTDDLKSLFSKQTKTKKKSDDKDDDQPLFEQSQITQAKRIMKPFVLRRLKRDVLKDLPKKTDHVVQCDMSQRQNSLYKQLIDRLASKDGTIHGTMELNGMTMMMDLRKLANHPLLLRYHYQERDLRDIARRLAHDPTYKEKKEQYVFEDLQCLSDFQIHQLTKQYKCISHCGVPDHLILDSGKFEWLDELLPRLKQGGHRVLIFSQFVMMLDILEPYLKLRGHRYIRLDGSTAVTDRQELIDQYNAEDIFVFLLSTRAGGLGINLTAADTVVIHDIDFNPYNDKQAEDRCHRLGQTREVTIHRLVSSGSIEEGIFQCAKEKLNLERDLTGAEENEPAEQRNVVRLLSLALGVTSPNK